MTHPIPDRFRVGEVWQSPRGKLWKVKQLHLAGGVVLVDAYLPKRSNQLRHGQAINGWRRIDPPHETQ
jgi:hypothetical protein